MEPRLLGVIADLDLCVRKLAQLFDRLDVRRAHIGRCYDAKLSAVLCELRQLANDQPQPAPLDKRNDHINAVA